MSMTVTLDRMIHTKAVHHDLAREIPLEGSCAFGGKGADLNPMDLMAMSLASCLMIVMAKSAAARGIDLTGTWADTAYQLQDYKVASMTVTIHSPQCPSDADRAVLEKESHRCPVYLVVKDGVDVRVAFDWGTKAAAAARASGKTCCRCGQ